MSEFLLIVTLAVGAVVAVSLAAGLAASFLVTVARFVFGHHHRERLP